jgi:hypothetical protein
MRSWFWREPLYRVVLGLLLVVDYFSYLLRWVGVLKDKSNFVPGQQVQLAFLEEKNELGVDFEDTFHEEALRNVLPGLWNWYLYGRLFPKLMIQPSLQRKRNVELRYKQRLQSGTLRKHLPLTIWIVGLPRTGSTFFHKLLALDDRGYAARHWELRAPVPPASGADSRLEDCRTFNKSAYSMMPKMRRIHNVEAEDPDECVMGFCDCAFPEFYLWGCRDMKPAYDWYMGSTMVPQYSNYKKLLQVLCSQKDKTCSSHVVLKSPHHTAKLKTIAKIFPNSRFVWLHRPLENVVASTCSMNETLNDYTDAFYLPSQKMGERTLDRLADVMKRGLKERRELEDTKKSMPPKFTDIYYNELIADPIGTVKTLYKECGLTVSKEFEQRLTTYLEDQAEMRRQRRSTGASHKYTLENFGLTKEAVNHQFEEYLKVHGEGL